MSGISNKRSTVLVAATVGSFAVGVSAENLEQIESGFPNSKNIKKYVTAQSEGTYYMSCGKTAISVQSEKMSTDGKDAGAGRYAMLKPSAEYYTFCVADPEQQQEGASKSLCSELTRYSSLHEKNHNDSGFPQKSHSSPAIRRKMFSHWFCGYLDGTNQTPRGRTSKIPNGMGFETSLEDINKLVNGDGPSAARAIPETKLQELQTFFPDAPGDVNVQSGDTFFMPCGETAISVQSETKETDGKKDKGAGWLFKKNADYYKFCVGATTRTPNQACTQGFDGGVRYSTMKSGNNKLHDETVKNMFPQDHFGFGATPAVRREELAKWFCEGISAGYESIETIVDVVNITGPGNMVLQVHNKVKGEN